MDVYSFGQSFGTSLNDAFGVKEHATPSRRAEERAAADAAERASDPTPPPPSAPSPSPDSGSSGRRPRPGNPPKPPPRPILPGRTRIPPIIVKPMRTEIVEVPRYFYSTNGDLIKILIAISVVLGIALYLRYR